MSFDDYQYKVANSNILDMTVDNKDIKKAKNQDDGSFSASSEEDEEDEDEDEENNELKNKKVEHI